MLPLYESGPRDDHGLMVAVCSLCGGSPDGAFETEHPLGWSADVVDTGDGPRIRWVCDACTRRYVRSIEAKLDHEWW